MSEKARAIIIIGGAISGLMSALALAKRGFTVSILEADAGELPETTDNIFEDWNRKGAPQTKHTHYFRAKTYQLLRDREPGLLEKLKEAGAVERTFIDLANANFDNPEFVESDDEITTIGCRRIVFEWVLRRYLLDTGLVEFRDGVKVIGLKSDSQSDGIPIVTGIKTEFADGSLEELPADLIIENCGQRSRLRYWLKSVSDIPMYRETSPSGIFYSSRFYQLLEGEEPPSNELIIAGDLGYVRFGIAPADNNTFSITILGYSDDKEIRPLLKTAHFDTFAKNTPLLSEWVNPEKARPLTDAIGMANFDNVHRSLIVDGNPIALGIVMLGDSGTCVNPEGGHGCSLATMSAMAFADMYSHDKSLYQLAMEYEEFVQEQVMPWFHLQVRTDLRNIEAKKANDKQLARERGEKPKKNRNKQPMDEVMENIVLASTEDIRVMRRFYRVFEMLEEAIDFHEDAVLIDLARQAIQKRNERKAAGEDESSKPGIFAGVEQDSQGPGRAELIAMMNETKENKIPPN